MKKIVYKNGYQTTYDDSFQAGELITAYKSGIHQFIKYVYRDEDGKSVGPDYDGPIDMYTPIVVFKQLYTSRGKPCKSKKELSCDASFCRKASERIRDRLREIEEEKDRLSNILISIKDENEK